MTTRHGDEDLVDDGWIGSSQLDVTEPEQPTPNSYAPRAPCPQPQALRNELHGTTLHCTALRRDAKRCDVVQRTRNCQRLAAGASRRARPSQIAPTLSPALLSFGEVKPSPIKRLLVLCALIVAPCRNSSMIDPLGGDSVTWMSIGTREAGTAISVEMSGRWAPRYDAVPYSPRPTAVLHRSPK